MLVVSKFLLYMIVFDCLYSEVTERLPVTSLAASNRSSRPNKDASMSSRTQVGTVSPVWSTHVVFSYPYTVSRCSTSFDVCAIFFIVLGEKNFVCFVPGCYKRFTTAQHAENHVRTHTGNPDTSHCCNTFNIGQ